MGTPTDETWPGLKTLTPLTSYKFPKYPGVKLQEVISPTTGLSESGYDLLSKMLAMDPEKRIDATEALRHQWF